jgi:hypothetical protein
MGDVFERFRPFKSLVEGSGLSTLTYNDQFSDFSRTYAVAKLQVNLGA